MADLSQSIIQQIRNEHGTEAEELIAAMKRDEGAERRRKQLEAEEYLINKAYEESLREAKAKQTAAVSRAQISESVMGAVLAAAGGDKKQAARLLEEFHQPATPARPNPSALDESTIIRKVLEESEKAEQQRQRRIAEEERKVALAMKLAIEKSKEDAVKKQLDAELVRMNKQLQDDMDKLAAEKALLAERQAQAKRREEELRARSLAEKAQEANRREEERLREEKLREERFREEIRAREEAERLLEAKRAEEKKQDEKLRLAERKQAEDALRRAEELSAKAAEERTLHLNSDSQFPALRKPLEPSSRPRVQDWIAQSILGPPKVSIYTDRGSTVGVAEMKTFLLTADPTLTEPEIFSHDFSHDYELANFVKEKCPHDTFPIAAIKGTPIGDLQTLKLNKQYIPALLKGELKELPSVQPKDVTRLGVLDSALNIGEYVVSGVGSLLALPVKILTWPFSSKSNEEKPNNEPEFQCVHQNWYYRNLVRIFRFQEKGFVRVHPQHKDIRGVHEYSTIASITLTDAENMVIQYNDGSSPDYIKASETDVKAMIQLIKTRSPKEITVNVETQ